MPLSRTSAPACTVRIAGSVSEAWNDVRLIEALPISFPCVSPKRSAHGTRSVCVPVAETTIDPVTRRPGGA